MATPTVKDFTLPATGGGTFQLAKAAAKILVFYFYPKDNTPGCTTEGLQFRDLHREFRRAGAEVYGISRDDSASFITAYQKAGIFERDPFVSIDTSGVGEMIKIAAARGRATRPDIKLGICGEHGGAPASIHFCREVGLDYVSCSPYRVPIARLAAAQAELAGEAGGSTA